MKEINIEYNEGIKKENLLVKQIIRKKYIKLKKENLNIIFIYLNLIIIYIIVFNLYKEYTKKSKNIKVDDYKNITSNALTLKYEKIFEQIVGKYKRSSIIWPLPREIKFRPIMTKNEIIALSYFMNPNNIYFEFGSGGSTNLASYYKIKTFSVESDIRWHKKLKDNGIVANYITIDLKVSHRGYPGKGTNVNDWKKYIQAYKSEYNANIILIDGRFRVACALDIFSKIKEDTLIFFHDYNREQYHIIEQFYIKIKMWDSLALLIKNPNINKIPEIIYNFYLKEKLL